MEKQVYESSTVRNATYLLLGVLSLLGVEVKNSEMDTIVELVMALVGTVGALAFWVRTIYGRVKANPNLRIGNYKLQK